MGPRSSTSHDVEQPLVYCVSEAVDLELLLGTVHRLGDRLHVGAHHLADGSRSHEDHRDGLVLGDVEHVQALLGVLGSLGPPPPLERVTDEGVEGLAVRLEADDLAELVAARVGELGAELAGDLPCEARVVVALHVHGERDVLVRRVEHVTASRLDDHVQFLLGCDADGRSPDCPLVYQIT